MFPTVKTEAKGFAEPFDERVPNKLRLKLKPQFLGMEIDTDNEGKYFVLATDYINYSVVYSCYETNYVFFSVKEEFSFILTRSKKPTDATVAIAKSQLSRFSDPANLLLTEQDCDN